MKPSNKQSRLAGCRKDSRLCACLLPNQIVSRVKSPLDSQHQFQLTLLCMKALKLFRRRLVVVCRDPKSLDHLGSSRPRLVAWVAAT